MEEMNLENQLQVAFATIAELRDQIDSLTRVNWSQEERLRSDARSRDEMRLFYENQMENLRKEQREALARLQEEHKRQIEETVSAAVSKITKSFEEQISKLIAERDAALLAVKHQRGKRFGGKSERKKGNDDGGTTQDGGENREAEKAEFVDAAQQRQKEMEKAASESSDTKTGETLDAEKLVKKLKRKHPGAEITVVRVDYSKSKSYMENPDDSHYHKLESYFNLSEGEYFRTGKNGQIEKSYLRVLIRHPEKYEEHVYEVAHVRSKDKDEYSTHESINLDRPIPGCMFSKEMLTYILCEKYLYHTPFRQILKKLRNRGLQMSKSVLGEHVHKAISWLREKLQPFWSSLVRKSWILMIDETRTLVGCKAEETDERKYKNKYMWGLRANSVNLAWFLYEDGSRGAEAIRPFLDGFLGFYTTDGYAVYKIFDSKASADESSTSEKERKGRRSACMVHIRRNLVDAMLEDMSEAKWFIDEIGKLFAIEHYCLKNGLTGHKRLIERLKSGSTADIMKRIEERLEIHRQSNYAGCGDMMKKAVRYALGEWPAMKRVLECGDVELSNNLSEQMMRSIKMNLKNAGNIGSEESAKHNAFMFSVIESCKMNKRSVEGYLKSLLDKLKLSRDGDDLTDLLPCNLAT